MKKEKAQTVARPVGANCVRPHIEGMSKKQNNKGITLIALVITIIVMLILVGVSVTVALNGGLFRTAKDAADETKIKRDEELKLSEGKVKINGEWYNSMAEYVGTTGNGGVPGGETPVTLPGNWSIAENKPENWSENVIAIKETATENIVPLPKNYQISSKADEQSVATGLVITDGQNEFVWIPVTTDLGSSYSSSSDYSEPKELTDTYSKSNAAYDSQTTLDYLYGENYYNYAEDFNYAEEYAEMVTSVNKYDGFYIGKYETTIDSEGNIGSEYNTEVLTAGSILKEGTNTNNADRYYYRWYGLYDAQKNANVVGNGETVQTTMIYGVLWDKTMDYIRAQKAAGYTTYDVDTETVTWHESANGHRGVVNSAQANEGDVALNIWDLESNAWEWTQEAYSTRDRVMRGSYYKYSNCASSHNLCYPNYSDTYRSSRVALYIK